MRRAIAIGVTVLALLSLAGCSSYRHCMWRPGDQAVEEKPGQYTLRFIEADDEGWFWNRDQAEDAMNLIRTTLRESDTVVVTFVHGWHHSAECCDDNVEGFKHTLSQLRTRLPDNFRVIGLYIGWRGRSLPGFLDYVTFWGRKGAAERVGQNDMKEFMARLQELYVEHRPDARRPGQFPTIPPVNGSKFLGMVTIGHSFGAQVLMKAIGGSLEDQLQLLNRHPAYLRDTQPGVPDPAQRFAVSGVGDLIVLLNPALEASQYHRIHMLANGLCYSSLQTPLILTVSSENDMARHKWFTAGRIAGEFFTGKPRKDNEVQRTVERQAFGVYEGHITHELKPADETVRLVSDEINGERGQCKNNGACKAKWFKWRSPSTADLENSLVPRDPKLADFDFSGRVVFEDVVLSPLAGKYSDKPPECRGYQPFIVARASRHIVDNHSGIFTEPFLQFLVPYIAYIEEKSKVNVTEKVQQRLDTEMPLTKGRE